MVLFCVLQPQPTMLPVLTRHCGCHDNEQYDGYILASKWPSRRKYCPRFLLLYHELYHTACRNVPGILTTMMWRRRRSNRAGRESWQHTVLIVLHCTVLSNSDILCDVSFTPPRQFDVGRRFGDSCDKTNNLVRHWSSRVQTCLPPTQCKQAVLSSWTKGQAGHKRHHYCLKLLIHSIARFHSCKVSINNPESKWKKEDSGCQTLLNCTIF